MLHLISVSGIIYFLVWDVSSLTNVINFFSRTELTMLELEMSLVWDLFESGAVFVFCKNNFRIDIWFKIKILLFIQRTLPLVYLFYSSPHSITKKYFQFIIYKKSNCNPKHPIFTSETVALNFMFVFLADLKLKYSYCKQNKREILRKLCSCSKNVSIIVQ